MNEKIDHGETSLKTKMKINNETTVAPDYDSEIEELKQAVNMESGIILQKRKQITQLNQELMEQIAIAELSDQNREVAAAAHHAKRAERDNLLDKLPNIDEKITAIKVMYLLRM